MATALAVGLMLLASLSSVLTNPDGAPPSTCIDMTPCHEAEGQTSDSPYEVVMDMKSLTSDGSLKLNITSDKPFKGFLIVGTSAETGEIVGMFKNPVNGKVLDCEITDDFSSPEPSSTPESADEQENYQSVNRGTVMPGTGFTHQDNKDKTSVSVEWMPNEFAGEVIFRTTFVENGNTFWAAVASDPIQVLDETSTASTSTTTIPTTTTTPSTTSTTTETSTTTKATTPATTATVSTTESSASMAALPTTIFTAMISFSLMAN